MEEKKQGRVTALVDTIVVKDMDVQHIIADALADKGYDVEITPEQQMWSKDTPVMLVIRQVMR